MLTAMRSGSTYLYRMLKGTKLFGFPDPHREHPSLKPQHDVGEFFAPNPHIDPWEILEIPRTKEICIQNLKVKANQPFKSPCLLKVLKEQYEYYMLDHKDRPLIESLFPATKYIWLERENLIDRAVSAYIFFTTKTPHLYNQKMADEYRKKEVTWDGAGMLDVYFNHMKDCDWAPFLGDSPFLKVSYENLVAQPAETLRKCLDYLRLDPRGTIDVEKIAREQPKLRTERPESAIFREKLKKQLLISLP